MSSRTSHRNGSKQSPRPRFRRKARKKVPTRGRRFSAEQHAEALSLIAAKVEREKVAKKLGCSTESLRRWYNEAKR
jgi:DNA invertase Pin-like site-specific DNA recombinase